MRAKRFETLPADRRTTIYDEDGYPMRVNRRPHRGDARRHAIALSTRGVR